LIIYSFVLNGLNVYVGVGIVLYSLYAAVVQCV